MQNCEAHKFETVIQLTGDDGKARSSKVKLCGNQGQSDADWIRTLKDAVTKASQSSDMPKAAKEQIVAAINAEIERLNGAAPSSTETAIEDAPRSAEPEAPLSRDYALLPPLPAPTNVAPPPILLPRRRASVLARRLPVRSAVRKCDAGARRASEPAQLGVQPSLRTADRPAALRDLRFVLEPSTLLVPRSTLRPPRRHSCASSGASLARGSDLPPLRHGQSATFALHGCLAGVVRSRVSSRPAVARSGNTNSVASLRAPRVAEAWSGRALCATGGTRARHRPGARS